MALPDLTGQNIENTYNRVVQTDGTFFYDGTGSLLNLGSSTDTGSFATTGSNRFNGNQTITGSLSQGSYNLAIGDYSHAEGRFTTSSGVYSHAEGIYTVAQGEGSHAEGNQAKAIGVYSHAEGIYTIASGDYSHAEGNSTQAIGNQSHAEGASSKTGATTAYYADQIIDGVLLLRGASYGDKTNEFSAGNTIIYDDVDFDTTYNRTTFTVLSSTFDGTNTIITLTDTTVQGSGAIIGNADTIAFIWAGDQTLRADYAHAEGSTVALGEYSHAEGENTQAIGRSSHTEGENTKTIGSYSHAEGQGSRTVGSYSHAEGVDGYALGASSHTEGLQTKTGQYGYYTTNIAYGIIVLPASYGDVTSEFVAGDYIILYDYDYDVLYTIARFEIGSASYTGGLTRIFLVDETVNSTQAIIGVYGRFQPTNADRVLGGYSAHAEGVNNKAVGPFSHAEGDDTQAIGQGSHTEGQSTQAIGRYSHTEGLDTIALGSYQHVQGKYNTTSSEQSAFIVGNGTSNASRSNLIHAAGNSVQVTGSLSVSGSVIVNNVDIQATIVAMAIALG